MCLLCYVIIQATDHDVQIHYEAGDMEPKYKMLQSRALLDGSLKRLHLFVYLLTILSESLRAERIHVMVHNCLIQSKIWNFMEYGKNWNLKHSCLSK